MEPPYIITDGERRVAPYEHVYHVHVKGRWLGRTLREVATSEFFYPPGYFDLACRDGLLSLDGVPGSSSTVLRSGQLLEHRTARVEPPVAAVPIVVLESSTASVPSQAPKSRRPRKRTSSKRGGPSAKRAAGPEDTAPEAARASAGAESPTAESTDDSDAPSGWSHASVVAVNKPATVPVHPTSRYFHNTLTQLLRREHALSGAAGRGKPGASAEQRVLSAGELVGTPVEGWAPPPASAGPDTAAASSAESASAPCLHLLHRIDRLTSGLVLLARDHVSASDVASALRGGDVAKLYAVRVRGDLGATVAALHAGEGAFAAEEGEGAAGAEAKARKGAEAEAGAETEAEADRGDDDGDGDGDDGLEEGGGIGVVSEELAPEGPWRGGMAPGDVAGARRLQSIPAADGAAPVTVRCGPGGGLVGWGEVGGSGLSELADPAAAGAVRAAVLGRLSAQLGADPGSAVDVRAALVTCPLKPFTERCNIMVAAPDGKPAATLIVPLCYDAATDTSLALARLFTGRTHQIRVHARFLGHPVCGDPMHGIPMPGPMAARLRPEARAEPPRPGFRAAASAAAGEAAAEAEAAAGEAGAAAPRQTAMQVALAAFPVRPLRHARGIGLHCLSMTLQLCPPAGAGAGPTRPGFCFVAGAGLPAWAHPAWGGWHEGAEPCPGAGASLGRMVSLTAALSTLRSDRW